MTVLSLLPLSGTKVARHYVDTALVMKLESIPKIIWSIRQDKPGYLPKWKQDITSVSHEYYLGSNRPGLVGSSSPITNKKAWRLRFFERSLTTFPPSTPKPGRSQRQRHLLTVCVVSIAVVRRERSSSERGQGSRYGRHQGRRRVHSHFQAPAFLPCKFLRSNFPP